MLQLLTTCNCNRCNKPPVGLSARLEAVPACQARRRPVGNVRAAGHAATLPICAAAVRPATPSANVRRFCPPWAQPLAVCPCAAASVRLSPATFGRKRAKSGLASRPPSARVRASLKCAVRFYAVRRPPSGERLRSVGLCAAVRPATPSATSMDGQPVRLSARLEAVRLSACRLYQR